MNRRLRNPLVAVLGAGPPDSTGVAVCMPPGDPASCTRCPVGRVTVETAGGCLTLPDAGDLRSPCAGWIAFGAATPAARGAWFAEALPEEPLGTGVVQSCIPLQAASGNPVTRVATAITPALSLGCRSWPCTLLNSERLLIGTLHGCRPCTRACLRWLRALQSGGLS